MFRLYPIAFDANSHVRGSLQSSQDNICRSCSSSSFDHAPVLFPILISGLKFRTHFWRHALLSRLPPTCFAIGDQFPSPYILTPSSNLLFSASVHLRFLARSGSKRGTSAGP